MVKEYTQKQRWELYKKLPEEVKEMLSAPETAETMNDICERFNIPDDKASVLTELVGQTLLGVLPPDEFQEALEEDVKLEKDVAKKVFHEINRFIFYPVKSSLEEVYRVPIKPPPAKPVVRPPAAAPPEEKPKAPPIKPDIYREAVE